MRAIFIRHGQSTGNAGLPSNDLSLIALTELGQRQAHEVAAEWTEQPDLVVTSPYLRTQQTAQLTIARFPGVPVEIWPIEEFTYLQPSRWNGTRSCERMPYIEDYWAKADPDYCDGEGAESFASLLSRAEAALSRLSGMPAHSLTLVFGHGQFIQAVRSLIMDQDMDMREKMQAFWRKGEPPAIDNAQRLEFIWGEGRWEPGRLQNAPAC